ncbi:MAG: MFS transporter, partial [Candidatus Contendobacter sp.]|nr:MFS transporter [Candidatus Contendobacter sp.]
MRLLRDHRGFLGLLLCLYFAQGLPSGLIAHALPALLRDAGVSLSVIGLTGLIAAPWMLKFLWAPFVDRYGSRRRWLIATNSLLLLAMLVLALWPLE